MRWIQNINSWLKPKPKAFLIDECPECEKELNIVRSMNVDVDKFSDFKHLLYTLQATKARTYKVGLIHEKDSKYSPQILSNFIKQIDPNIQLIIYKNESELQMGTKMLSLT